MTKNGLLAATTDRLQVDMWWSRVPNANVGIRMGTESGLIAIDIDPGKGGRQTLVDLCAQYGQLPPTETARTGGGGEHYFFRHPGGHIGTGTNVLGPGIDVRGDGGYVCAPPSNHISGRTYTWEDDSPASELPPWLLTLLTTKKPSEHIDVEAVLAGVPEGQRDSTLFRTASKLRWAGVPLDMAERLILEAAANCSPPFPEAAARAKVASAYGRYVPTLVEDENGDRLEQLEWDRVRITTITPAGPVMLDFAEMERGSRELNTEMTVRLLMADRPADPYRQRLNMLSISARESCRRELEAVFGRDAGWAAVLSRSMTRAHDAFERVDRTKTLSAIPLLTEIPSLVADLMPAEGPTIFFGAGSAGKTYLALSIALACATGASWLGRDCEKRSVLWIDYETGEQRWGWRLRRLMAGLKMTDEPPIYYWDAQGVPLVDQLPAIRQATERHACGLVVIDHAAAAAGVKPEEADAALRVQRGLGKINLPTLLIAHITGEAERDPAQVLRPFGSIFWRNMARCMWYVSGVQKPGSQKTATGLYGRKLNDGDAQQDFGVNIYFEPGGGPVEVEPAELNASDALNAIRGQQWTIYEAFKTVSSFTTSEAGEAIEKSARHARAVLRKYPELFRQTDPGAGKYNEGRWQCLASAR